MNNDWDDSDESNLDELEAAALDVNVEAAEELIHWGRSVYRTAETSAAAQTATDKYRTSRSPASIKNKIEMVKAIRMVLEMDSPRRGRGHR